MTGADRSCNAWRNGVHVHVHAFMLLGEGRNVAWDHLVSKLAGHAYW
jgi:hypothetical protein